MDMKGNGNMAIKEITIGFSRTVNLGNYESARVEASVKLDVIEGRSLDVQIAEVQIELGDLLKKTWIAQMDALKPKAK
jgi:hypothetical protein